MESVTSAFETLVCCETPPNSLPPQPRSLVSPSAQPQTEGAGGRDDGGGLLYLNLLSGT